MKIKCPNCGTEFVPADQNQSTIPNDMLNNIDGTGYLLPKEIHNDNINNFNQEKENSNMNTITNFDMETLAKMVAEKINNPAKTDINVVADDKNGWAKTSQFYGKELCGYIYNPYTVRRHLPRKFLKLMQDYELNVDKGIKTTVSYMESIKYMIDECKKLAMLEKRDPIAFDERRHFWSVSDCKTIFREYFENVILYLNKLIEDNNATDMVKVDGINEYIKIKDRIDGHYNGKAIISKYSDSPIFDEIDKNKIKISRCFSYQDLYKLMSNVQLVKLFNEYYGRYEYSSKLDRWILQPYFTSNGFKLSKAFVEGYKKSGAYYTAKNLIMFNNKMFEGLQGREAVDYLRSLLNNGEPAFIIYAKLKDALK